MRSSINGVEKVIIGSSRDKAGDTKPKAGLALF
jgi:hypothetical protein